MPTCTAGTVLASLSLAHPELAAVVFVLTVALTPGWRSSRASAWLLRVAGGALAVLLSVWLLLLGTTGAYLLLAVLAAGGAACQALRSYLGLRGRLPGATVVACAVLRTAAWLLVLVALLQPAWRWTSVRFEKPLLALLLDQSRSMGIVDRLGATADERSRAEQVNAALEVHAAQFRRLTDQFDQHVLGFGSHVRTIAARRIEPEDDLTDLAGALREAAAQRSEAGEPPKYLLIISDGSDTTAAEPEVAAATAALAEQELGVLAVSAGPRPELIPAVKFDPLVLPARIGPRDRVAASVRAEVRGLQGAPVAFGLFWNNIRDRREIVRPDSNDAEVQRTFVTQPPGIGVYRVTARAQLPASYGGSVFETSTVTEVVDDTIRVLYLEGGPRSEIGFIRRALGAHGDIELTLRLIVTEDDWGDADPADLFSGYDVVIYGMLPVDRVPPEILRGLRDAVRDDGLGLLLAGGRLVLNSGNANRRILETASPVAFGPTAYDQRWRPIFLPTPLGRGHPVLSGVAQDPDDWRTLPTLDSPARFGRLTPLGSVLATDQDGRPLMVAAEVGRGRSLAVAWDATWPWALASDVGYDIQRRIFPQMIQWLANRRPRAWVLTDRGEYTDELLRRAEQPVLVRAGVTGVAPEDARRYQAHAVIFRVASTRPATQPADSGNGAAASATQPATQPFAPASRPAPLLELDLARRDYEWRASLDAGMRRKLAPGEYEVRLEATLPDAAEGGPPPLLNASTTFRVSDQDVELRPPTANPGLLADLAQRTAEEGGAFVPLAELPALLDRLMQEDHRRRVEQTHSYAPRDDNPWLLLVLVVLLLGLEWAVRKRAGVT